MEVFTLISGVIVGAIIFYVRSAILLAHRQKEAAIRLLAYLYYWREWLIDHDAFALAYIGISWNEEIRELLGKGGTIEDVVNLEEEKKKIVERIQEEVSKLDISDKLPEVLAVIEKLPSDSLDKVLESMKVLRQNLIEGKTFISDSEAVSMGLHVMTKSISVKMNIISMADTILTIIFGLLADKDNFKIDRYAKEVSVIVWKGMKVSRDIDMLINIAKRESSKSIFTLVVENLNAI